MLIEEESDSEYKLYRPNEEDEYGIDEELSEERTVSLLRVEEILLIIPRIPISTHMTNFHLQYSLFFHSLSLHSLIYKQSPIIGRITRAIYYQQKFRKLAMTQNNFKMYYLNDFIGCHKLDQWPFLF